VNGLPLISPSRRGQVPIDGACDIELLGHGVDRSDRSVGSRAQS